MRRFRGSAEAPWGREPPPVFEGCRATGRGGASEGSDGARRAGAGARDGGPPTARSDARSEPAGRPGTDPGTPDRDPGRRTAAASADRCGRPRADPSEAGDGGSGARPERSAPVGRSTPTDEAAGSCRAWRSGRKRCSGGLAGTPRRAPSRLFRGGRARGRPPGCREEAPQESDGRSRRASPNEPARGGRRGSHTGAFEESRGPGGGVTNRGREGPLGGSAEGAGRGPREGGAAPDSRAAKGRARASGEGVRRSRPRARRGRSRSVRRCLESSRTGVSRRPRRGPTGRREGLYRDPAAVTEGVVAGTFGAVGSGPAQWLASGPRPPRDTFRRCGSRASRRGGRPRPSGGPGGSPERTDVPALEPPSRCRVRQPDALEPDRRDRRSTFVARAIDAGSPIAEPRSNGARGPARRRPRTCDRVPADRCDAPRHGFARGCSPSSRARPGSVPRADGRAHPITWSFSGRLITVIFPWNLGHNNSRLLHLSKRNT